MDVFTSNTPYDDAFRTMEGRCDDLLIPFVSHMFGEEYDQTAVVKRLRNERFSEQKKGSVKERITDSYFEIIFKHVVKKYHLECESKRYDGTILVRIFEYDAQIALHEGEKSMERLRVRFPNTGLMLLRSSPESPKKAVIDIEMQDGKEVSYSIPIIRVSDYTIEEIFEKRLYMLIPFYIFAFEKELSEIDQSRERIEELVQKYDEVFKRLRKDLEEGRLSILSFGVIIRFSYIIIMKLTSKQTKLHERIGDVMGGKIVELDIIKAVDEARKEEAEKWERKEKEEARRREQLEKEIEQLKKENAELKAAVAG